jgi:hypothetical protein
MNKRNLKTKTERRIGCGVRASAESQEVAIEAPTVKQILSSLVLGGLPSTSGFYSKSQGAPHIDAQVPTSGLKFRAS